MPSPILWLRSDTQVYQDNLFTVPAVANGDPVGGWQDLSGNGNHYTQAGAANKPFLQNGVTSGLVVRFDGLNDFMSQSTVTLSLNAFSMFCVARHNGLAASGFSYVITETSGTEFTAIYLKGGAGISPLIQNRRLPGPTLFQLSANEGYDDGILRIYEAIVGAGASTDQVSWFTNASEISLAGTWSDRGVKFDELGRLVGAGTTYGGQDIAELIIYGEKLNDVARCEVEQYLAEQYGLINSNINCKLPARRIAIMSGRIITKTENTVWLGRSNNFTSPDWGGECMRIDDITKNLPGRNPTYCQDAREGGVKVRPQTTQSLAGLPTTSLVMKESLHDVIADSLETCLWNIDRRTHCGNLDNAFKWEKIRRICGAGITSRVDMGSDFDTDETENMSTLAVTGNDVITINRVAASVQSTPLTGTDVSYTAIDVCHGERCSSRCNSEEECVVAIVSSLEAAGSPHLGINNNGGAAGYWTDITLTEWTTADAIAVKCLGDFILIASDIAGGDTQFLRSYDQGTTRVELTGNTDMASNAVACLDAVTQAYIVAGGLNGYIYGSTDSGTTWETLDAGVATTENINKIAIARDNTSIIYAIGQNNAIVKSENGGETFFTLTGPSATDNLTAIYILEESHILVGNDDGELWESNDGGETWTVQAAMPDFTPAAGSTSIVDIVGCGCGVLWLAIADDAATSWASDTEQLVFRNVDRGASGYWYLVENGQLLTARRTVATGDIPTAMACCGPNRAIVVGGLETATASGFVAVVA